MIEWKCQNCGESVQVSSPLAAFETDCPQCGRRVLEQASTPVPTPNDNDVPVLFCTLASTACLASAGDAGRGAVAVDAPPSPARTAGSVTPSHRPPRASLPLRAPMARLKPSTTPPVRPRRPTSNRFRPARRRIVHQGHERQLQGPRRAGHRNQRLAAALVALQWGYNPLAVAAVNGFFLAVELVFVAANARKLVEGGWFPLALALAFLMLTWRKGAAILEHARAGMRQPEDEFVRGLLTSPPLRLPGTAAVFTAAVSGIPLGLTHHLRHNRVLHERCC